MARVAFGLEFDAFVGWGHGCVGEVFLFESLRGRLGSIGWLGGGRLKVVDVDRGFWKSGVA